MNNGVYFCSSNFIFLTGRLPGRPVALLGTAAPGTLRAAGCEEGKQGKWPRRKDVAVITLLITPQGDVHFIPFLSHFFGEFGFESLKAH